MNSKSDQTVQLVLTAVDLQSANSAAILTYLRLKFAIDLADQEALAERLPLVLRAADSAQELSGYAEDLATLGAETSVAAADLASDSGTLSATQSEKTELETTEPASQESSADSDSYDLEFELDEALADNPAKRSENTSDEPEEFIVDPESLTDADFQGDSEGDSETNSEPTEFQIFSSKDGSPEKNKISRKQNQLVLNTLLTILIAVIVFSVSLLFIDADNSEQIKKDVEVKLNKIVKSLALDAAEPVENTFVRKQKYRAKFTVDRVTFLAEITAKPSKAYEVTIYGENGAVQTEGLYLTRIDYSSQNIKNIEADEESGKVDTSFENTGVLKIFIEHEGQLHRPTTKAYVTGQIDPLGKFIQIRLLVNRGFAELPETSQFIIDPEAPENVKVFIDEEIRLEKKSKL